MSHVSRRGTRRREPGSRWLPVMVAVLTMRGHFIPLKDTPAGTDGERDELGARHGLPCPRGPGGRRPPLMDSAGRPALLCAAVPELGKGCAELSSPRASHRGWGAGVSTVPAVASERGPHPPFT